MHRRWRLRRFCAAVLVSAFVALGALPGLANQDGGNDGSEQRDTQSRNEQDSLDSIPLRTEAGLFYMKHLFVVQTRFVFATDTFFEGIGVDFDNLDRADVSDVPLLGSLFDKPLRGEDLTQENRVGSVYRGADGTLVAVVDEAVDVPESEVSVVNGKGRYTIRKKPELAEIDVSQLGALGELGSIQTLVRGVAPRETAIVLSGLTATSEPKVDGNIPLLGDIPGLRNLFMGDMHKLDKDELVIVVRPTIIRGDETEE
jgi:hypothetical protein